MPILRLNSRDILLLQFDDLIEDEKKTYYYKIMHCTRDWKPSNVIELDYIDGFNNEPLRNWDFSELTKMDFTHYWLQIPNRDTKLKISGNYIIHIYDRNSDNKPILSRRFMVTEDVGSPLVNFVQPSRVLDIRTSHQLNVTANTSRGKINNPMSEVTLTAVQNGDWESAIYDVAPLSISNGELRFDPFGTLRFRALREFRFFDTRSLQSRSRGVESITKNVDSYDVLLTPDGVRSTQIYGLTFDFNGKFYIDNIDRVSSSNGLSQTQSTFPDSVQQSFIVSNQLLDGEYQSAEKDVRADYANVEFVLVSEKLPGEVFIFGALSDWRTDNRFKMDYDSRNKVYHKTLVLKQGYYDYMYGFKDADNSKVTDLSYIEGSWAETENDYYIFLYSRQFGARYDRLLGYRIVGSNDVRLR